MFTRQTTFYAITMRFYAHYVKVIHQIQQSYTRTAYPLRGAVAVMSALCQPMVTCYTCDYRTGTTAHLGIQSFQHSMVNCRSAQKLNYVVASTHRLSVFSTSARHDVLLSAIDRLLLPDLDFGTGYLLLSGLPRHSQHFVKS